MAEPFLFYAHEFTRRDGEVYLGDIFPDPGVTFLGDMDMEVVEYRAVEDADGTYWAWKEPGRPIDLIRETREFLSRDPPQPSPFSEVVVDEIVAAYPPRVAGPLFGLACHCLGEYMGQDWADTLRRTALEAAAIAPEGRRFP